MKTVTKENNVTRMGIQKTTQCGMVVNAKAFELLARQYSDPPKAIIQEIGANAADSHVRAGKEDIPFSVKLPNSLDPHLRIRDYGIGMSKDIIYNVYINYMQSDKTDTNAETGCFGIGSKTPLAYADQFNITTYNDGTMTMYSLVKNEQGVPELNEFGDYATDEENGVEISFSVKEDDFDRFGRKAYEVYSFFNTRPTVTGNGSFNYEEEKKPVLAGSDWKLYGGYGEAYAVMGNIAYPIDDDQFDYRSKYREFLYNSCRIEIPLGDLNITPSRESLEYTEHTINGLKKAIDKVLGEANDQLELEMHECQSWWQAKILSQKIKGKLHGMPDMPALETFQGESLGDVLKLPYKKLYKIKGSKVKATNWELYDGGHSVHPDEESRIVVQDIPTLFDKKCRFFCAENDFTIYLVSKESIGSLKELKESMRVCEDDNVIILASELPDPPKVVNPHKGISHGTRKKTASMREFRPNGDNQHYGQRYQARWWSEAEVDIKNDPDKKLYVRWYNYEVTEAEGHRDIDPQRLCGAFKGLGIEVPTIYGLKDNQISTAKKQANWMCLKEWALMALKAFLDQNEGWEKSLQYKNIANDCSWLSDLSELIDKFDLSIDNEESSMGNLIRGLKGRGIEKFSSNILAIARSVCYNLDYEETDSSLDTLIDDVRNRYPLIVKMFKNTYVSNWDEDEVLNLFEMVDAFDRINLEGGC